MLFPAVHAKKRSSQGNAGLGKVIPHDKLELIDDELLEPSNAVSFVLLVRLALAARF